MGAAEATRSLKDINTGENPWNGIREIAINSEMFIVKCKTREKPETQQSSSAVAAMTGWQPANRVLVQQAGEVEGSGNMASHDVRSSVI